MRIEVVHHKDDFFSIRIHDVCKVPDFFRPVKRCAAFSYAYMMPPSKRFYKSKYADGAVTDIFGICFPVTSPESSAVVPLPHQEAGMVFIDAYHRTFLIIGKFVNVKNIFHTGYEFLVLLLPDAPVVVFVGSKFVFFKALRIASLPTGVSRITLDSFSSRRIVHRECPSGTGPQASSISRASVRPSILRLALSEFTFLLNSVTASMPPFIYFVTVLVTVAMQTPFDLALCSWVKTFPWASSRSRMIWHLLGLFCSFFVLMKDFNVFNSFSVRWILYFFGLAIGITAVSFYYTSEQM